jgi:hypothetical protein
MIKCSECGFENMDGLDYCDGCGAKLNPSVEAHASDAPPPSPPAASGEQTHQPVAGEEFVTSGEPGNPSPAAEPPHADEASTVSVPPAAPEPSRAPTGEITAPAPQPAPAAAVIGVPFKAKLSIVRGSLRRGHEFELESGNNLIGRWDPETGSFPEVDLDADDPEAKISRKHALIRIDSGKITLEDVGSLNGTYVNRQPRLQPGNPVDLKDGDEIIIGKTFLKLSVNPIS